MLTFAFTSGSVFPVTSSAFLRRQAVSHREGLCGSIISTSIPQPKNIVVHCKRGSGGGRDNKRRGDGRRPNRVGELIRREISPIIDDAFARSFRLEDGSSPVLVSVVDVSCSDDLRNAKVNVSIYGTDEEKSIALQWLRRSRREIRYELAQCVKLKYMPELSFAESEMLQAVKTVNILNMLAKEREMKQAGEEEETETVVNEQDLDMDASAEDAIIVDDLDEYDGLIDEEDEGEDAQIIEVTESNENMDEISDERVKSIVFNFPVDDNMKH